MEVSFIVATSLFLLFVSLVLVSAINYFVRTPESATILELRSKTNELFDVFFGSGGIVTNERVTTDLYRVPLILEERNGTARTNEVVSLDVEFHDTCNQPVSWNDTVRVYDQNFLELPSKISYQVFCSSRWLNTSQVAFIVNMSANEKKTVYVYAINNSNTTFPNHNTTLKGYWKFDETSGTLARDSSGWQNNGTLKNGTDACADGTCPQWTTGIFGNAIKLDGVNDHVLVSDSGSTNVTNSFTLAAWVRKNQTGVDQTVIDHRDASDNGYGMRFTDGDNFRCFVNSQGANLRVTTSTTVGVGVWTHVACSLNNTNMSVYINGIYITSGSLSANAGKGSGTTKIGASSTDTQYFNGTIDDVRIYNETLTPSQISTLALTSNQPLNIRILPPETISAISASKVQELSDRNYPELKSLFGGDYDFRIEIREKR